MTREEQIEQDAWKYDKENPSTCSEDYKVEGFIAGAKWADFHPIISKNLLEQLVEGIESGKFRTLSEYSNTPELSKAYDDGQISVLKLLLLIDYGPR